MQIGEKSAVASESNEKEEDPKKEEEKCQFIAYAKRPSGKGPVWAAGKLGGSERGDDETGHTFCVHIDESGKKSWYGFYPKGSLDGWRNVPEEDRIVGFLGLFKFVAGKLTDEDDDHEKDDKLVYEIERNQYDKVEQFASNWKSTQKKYCLALQNCTTFVLKDGKTMGISLPSGGWIFDNPAAFGKNIEKSS